MENESLAPSALDVTYLVGVKVKDTIIYVAELLTRSESSPGLIALALFGFLILLSILFLYRTHRQKAAITQMDALIREFDSIPEFADGYVDLRRILAEKSTRNAPSRTLWESWDEYCETIVPDDVDGPLRLRNSIRPSSFMNIEDLGFGPSLYRVVPNTFVSAGLFLTFLGLVAALHQFSQSMAVGSAGMETAMQNFMQIASAKFIMSLVGLLCSILFNILLRMRTNSLDHALQKLCIGIERRLVFVSLEDLGFRQLRAATEQREHLREIGMGMVAELQKPLEALPDRITSAIADTMDPIFAKVTSMGTSNMEGLVGDLSSQLSQSVGNALTRASESLGEATDRIGLMVDRMSDTNSQAGDGLQNALEQMSKTMSEMRSEVAASGRIATESMNEGAEKLLSVMNETLTGIRDNTGQGAEAMRIAAEDMRKAAEGFRETLEAASTESADAVRVRMAESSSQASAAIEGAGQNLLDSFGSTSREIARLGTEMGDVIGEELMTRIETVGMQLEDMAEAIQRSAAGTQTAAAGMSNSANAINDASDGFRSASSDLVAAAEPIRASHDRIEGNLRRFDNTVETVSQTLMQNSASVAESAAHVLQTAQTALGTEREGIRNMLDATRAALAQISREAEKLDQIDELLGHALLQYSTQLDAALGSAQDHVSQMRDTLAPGIDTLKSVVEQAEAFLPAQRRTKT